MHLHTQVGPAIAALRPAEWRGDATYRPAGEGSAGCRAQDAGNWQCRSAMQTDAPSCRPTLGCRYMPAAVPDIRRSSAEHSQQAAPTCTPLEAARRCSTCASSPAHGARLHVVRRCSTHCSPEHGLLRCALLRGARPVRRAASLSCVRCVTQKGSRGSFAASYSSLRSSVGQRPARWAPTAAQAAGRARLTALKSQVDPERSGPAQRAHVGQLAVQSPRQVWDLSHGKSS